MKSSWTHLSRSGAILLLLSTLSFAAPMRTDRSSVIKAYIYYEDEKSLVIFFTNENKRTHKDVPKSVFEGLKKAALKGGHYKAFIEDNYAYEEEKPDKPKKKGS